MAASSGTAAATLRYSAAVIGGSLGGLVALQRVLETLPSSLEMAILVALHRDATSEGMSQVLGRRCRLTVKEADDKERIRAGVVYLAPANYHLLVELDHSLSLSVDEPVNYARPSIDLLFETAADAYAQSLIGILLTGANSDGAHGLCCVRARGGMTIAQDPASARAETMPFAAIQLGVVERVLSLEAIGKLLATAGAD